MARGHRRSSRRRVVLLVAVAVTVAGVVAASTWLVLSRRHDGRVRAHCVTPVGRDVGVVGSHDEYLPDSRGFQVPAGTQYVCVDNPDGLELVVTVERRVGDAAADGAGSEPADDPVPVAGDGGDARYETTARTTADDDVLIEFTGPAGRYRYRIVRPAGGDGPRTGSFQLTVGLPGGAETRPGAALRPGAGAGR